MNLLFNSSRRETVQVCSSSSAKKWPLYKVMAFSANRKASVIVSPERLFSQSVSVWPRSLSNAHVSTQQYCGLKVTFPSCSSIAFSVPSRLRRRPRVVAKALCAASPLSFRPEYIFQLVFSNLCTSKCDQCL